ncbi:MAG: hypothetical protein C7B45_05175 [Sulfobacillus acidophilus]|uniref:Uncharacterized protein n=1 Tax=Sulfobacillus acidophilus TaxID=53633 RepID=A0A2T2WKY1_9FIRM|nr:MAG: hypothetical protein C7B45_05175 [Sulfobacillus acidophilus]
MAAIELRLIPLVGYLLLAVALALLALTHGPLELARNWQRHFIENMEAFVPLSLALLSAPMLIADSEQGMVELNATLPHRAILTVRFLAVWAVSWAFLLAGAEFMNLLWGPVPFWSGVLAAFGPAVFLTGVAFWATLITARVSVGYLVVIGLCVTDLILKILGAFATVPALQLIDTFSYRWATPALSWWVPKVFMLAVGIVLIVQAIRLVARYWSRSL